MKNKMLLKNQNITRIGHIAKELDTNFTLSERMKIKKVTYSKIAGSFVIYLITMFCFSIVL